MVHITKREIDIIFEWLVDNIGKNGQQKVALSSKSSKIVQRILESPEKTDSLSKPQRLAFVKTIVNRGGEENST